MLLGQSRRISASPQRARKEDLSRVKASAKGPDLWDTQRVGDSTPTRSHALLHAWCQGDKDAGNELVDRHIHELIRFVGRRIDSDIEDVVQACFLIALERADRLHDNSSFRGFLFGIAFNLCRTRQRQIQRNTQRVTKWESLCDTLPSLREWASRRQSYRKLIESLRKLPEREQLVLELHYWEGLRVVDIAEAMDEPTGTIKWRLARARRLLKDLIGDMPPLHHIQTSLREDINDWAKEIRKSTT